jgi:hypothetical protein
MLKSTTIKKILDSLKLCLEHYIIYFGGFVNNKLKVET